MNDPHEKDGRVNDDDTGSRTEIQRPWQEPKLEFVEPKLVKQGDMKETTGQGFIGTFVPD